jgi:hypothetical protein
MSWQWCVAISRGAVIGGLSVLLAETARRRAFTAPAIFAFWRQHLLCVQTITQMRTIRNYRGVHHRLSPKLQMFPGMLAMGTPTAPTDRGTCASSLFQIAEE